MITIKRDTFYGIGREGDANAKSGRNLSSAYVVSEHQGAYRAWLAMDWQDAMILATDKAVLAGAASELSGMHPARHYSRASKGVI